MQADRIREKFLKFFELKKHKIIESDSLVPKDDPSVLFTPAGMNQFKKEFIGFGSGFKRAATAQRCLRTGDLERVGKTCGHHTFFEMLGNFSFGDYFKKEAIGWAWEFLTNELGIAREKLWASVYKDDNEAYLIWKDLIKLPEEKIIRFGDKENFWPSEAKEKGPNGPCGPCSEIFYDWGKDTGCLSSGCNPSCSCGRFIEVWNLVFTQYNRKQAGVLEPLPQKNIDTGMGLERLAAVMQGVASNFKTDLFKPIVDEISSGINSAVSDKNRQLIYAIADHIRAVTFAIYDGVLPSNDGRGYVIRKVIRKSVLHLKELGEEKPFLYKLVPLVSQVMKNPYPQLNSRKENIAEIILSEEKNFILTLDSSGKLFSERFRDVLKKHDQKLAGITAFNLYDTHGIPFEMTQGWLKKQGLEVPESVFNKELEKQKERSRISSSMKGEVFSGCVDFKVKQSRFLGYEGILAEAKILKIVKDDQLTEKINNGDYAAIILEQTPFYPESGGQVSDTGRILKGKNVFTVNDTKKVGKVILHFGSVSGGSFKKEDRVRAEVNSGRRLSIARNHTATHLLQAALRKVLGEHVKQQGSLVAEEKLRFDFAHFKDLDNQELRRIEEQINGYIMSNFKVAVKPMKLSDAKKNGALAFFAEKYDEKVRVVSMGGFSKELCGGTHLEHTGEIGLFKIIQESSVASGVRRIEAVTGIHAYKAIKKEEAILLQAASILNTTVESIPQAIEANLSRMKALEKSLAGRKLEEARALVDNLIAKAELINGMRFIAYLSDETDMDFLRKNVDLIKDKVDNAVIALAGANNERALLVLGLSEDLCKKGIDASKLIREIAGIFGGSGGGRKDFAQAGGSKPQDLTKAIDELKKILERKEL